MATLTYARAWSRDQIRDAQIFIRDHYERPASTGIGCAQGTPLELVWSSVRTSDIFITAHDADGIAAVYAVADQSLKAGPEFVHYDPAARWVVTAVAALPKYDPSDILWNMGVAMCNLLFEQGGEQWQSWTSPELLDACRALPWCDWDKPSPALQGWYEIGGSTLVQFPDGTTPPEAYRDTRLV